MLKRHLVVVVTTTVLGLGLSLGCAHAPRPLEITRLSDGRIASGTIHLPSRSIEVTLPDGERFSGRFASVAEQSSPDFGLGAVGGHSFWSLTWPLDNKLTCYTVLTGSRGTVLEVDFIHDGRPDGEGFGTARTNSGQEYRFMTAIDDQ